MPDIPDEIQLTHPKSPCPGTFGNGIHVWRQVDALTYRCDFCKGLTDPEAWL